MLFGCTFGFVANRFHIRQYFLRMYFLPFAAALLYHHVVG
jgi:hypothetical protein